MLFFDRYSWLRTLGAVACGLYGVALPVWYLGFVVPLDVRHGVPVWADSLAAVAAVAVRFVLAVLLWRSAGPAHYREQVRRGEVTDTHLLPSPADLQLWPDQARRLPALPMTVRFPDSKLPGSLLALLAAPMGAGGLAVVVFGLVRQPTVYAEALAPGAAPPDPISTPPFGGFAAGVALIVAGALWFCVVSREGLAQPVAISATYDGICAQTWWGRRRCIPWRELRLVEVSAYSYPHGRGGGMSRIQVYTLHSQHGRIRWQDDVGKFGDLCEDTPELRDVIREHAGQEPRTFDRRLQVTR